MAGQPNRPPDFGDFNFLGKADGDEEGSLAFSDISFPSHVSDLESFHSDLDMSVHSNIENLPTDVSGGIEQNYEEADTRENDRVHLPDFPEQASENVDVLLAALKAATVKDTSNDRASSGTNMSSNSSNYDSSRFISKETFPESVLGDTSQTRRKTIYLDSLLIQKHHLHKLEVFKSSWTKEVTQLSQENLVEAPTTVLYNEKSHETSNQQRSETSVVKPESDSRLSEKFFAPSKTPDNGNLHAVDESRSPWSFSGDSLVFQTPRPATDDSRTLVKIDTTSSKRGFELPEPQPASSLTPVKVNLTNQFPEKPSIANDSFPQQDETRLSNATRNPFDDSTAVFQKHAASKRVFQTKPKPSSSSTPVEANLSNLSKQFADRPSISNDTFDITNVKQAVYNPFDGSVLNENEFESGKTLFGGGEEFFSDGDFSFQSEDDAAKRLDQDEKIFEENHRFDKNDAMIPDDQIQFSYYVLPGEESSGRPLVIGINDPDDKGEVRISFSEFFAAKTEELGRLGDGKDGRLRPQFSDAHSVKVSPEAMPPRPLYRPSSPEGSEKVSSYQPSFADFEKNRSSQSRSEKMLTMATRSSPYGAEAEEEDGKDNKKSGGKNIENGDFTKAVGTDRKSSQQKQISAQSSNAEGQGDPSASLELNNSTLAALKFCNSNKGSKLSAMNSKELKTLSKTLARANIDDAQEIYKVLVDFINKKGSDSVNPTELNQRLSEVFESGRGVGDANRERSEPQEEDALTFYHSDTSCEVSPTDPKFRTMSSISSPPLDTSSPKTNLTGDLHAPPSDPLIASTTSHTGTVTIAPKQSDGLSVQGTESVPSKHDGASSSQHGMSGTNTIPSTFPDARTDSTTTTTITTSKPQNSSLSRSHIRSQVSSTTNLVPVDQQVHIPNARQSHSPDSGVPNFNPKTSVQVINSTDMLRYTLPESGYQISEFSDPNIGARDPTAVPRYPMQAANNVAGQRYYQYAKVEQVDSGTNRLVADVNRGRSVSSHVVPAQSHAFRFPSQANAEASHAFLTAGGVNTVPPHATLVSDHLIPRIPHANEDQKHALRFSGHAVPVSEHAFTQTERAIVNPNYVVSHPSHPSTGTEHAYSNSRHAMAVPGHAFVRQEHAISDTDHAIPVSNHAGFRRIQLDQAQRQGSTGCCGTGDVFAQSCPVESFTPPISNQGLTLRTLHPDVSGKARSMSGGHSAPYQNRQLVPSKFQDPKSSSAPRLHNVLSYEDSGLEEYHVLSQDGTRRLHAWPAPGQRQEEVWNSRTERTSQIQMVIPPVLDFTGVLCVGTSTEANLSIHNPTSRWIRCSSEIVNCTVNGLKVDNQESPFSIRGKTMIGPKLTENIKVDFKCSSAGVYVADMKVISTPVASISGDIETSSAFVSLQGFAEEPKIEIIADELRTLDFGEVHHGCNSVKALRIINKGMTNVPLKMRICSTSSPGLFIFSKANSSDAIPWLDLQNTTLKCVVPAASELGIKPEPLVIWIELCGKNQHHLEKSDESEILSAGINIQLDTGTVAKILGNIQLMAIMGFTKIQIPKAFQMAMCLSAPVGKQASREFPFTNAGSICSNVELTVPKHVDVFSVSPEKFQVRPGMAVMVKVVFTPLCQESYESVIQVLEPDNSKSYEVLLRGSAVEPKPETDDGPPILSNKSWLCWTGVDLGNATHQRLFLLNDSSDQSIHFQAMILGEHSDFEIQRMRSEFSKGGASSEQMVLRPKERMPIYVLFAPSSFGVFKSALVLKPDRGPRFQIPLYAYGGKSCLSFLDLKKTSEGFDAQLGQVSLGRRNILKVTLKNTGQRAAFVKAVCYADFQIRLHYHQTHLSIVPSEFILPARASKELVIVYQPLQHDAKACQNETKRVATVVFYHGDEVLRQWYRRNILQQHGQEFSGKRTSRNLKHEHVQFDKVFQDENCVAEDFDFPVLENYERIFDSHISQMFLNLLGGNEKLSVDEETVVMATPQRRCVEPGKEISSQVKNDKSEKESLEKDDSTVWSMIPDQLSLKVPVEGSTNSTKKVQLLNFSNRPLDFELIWPAHCVAVTPHHGTIAPKSQVTVNISAWGSILKSGVDLPWCGTTYVKCDGVKKAIAIQIHNPLVSDNSPAPSIIDKPLSIIKTSKDEPRLSQTHTAVVKPVKQAQVLKITPTIIDFEEVEVNKASCATLAIENISSSSLRWKISSFAPAYAKVSDTSSELLRATYPVFSFSTQSGFIRPNQVVKVQIEFRARDVGNYCQIWDCQTNPESPLTSTKVKLELSGKAIMKENWPKVAEPENKKGVVDKKWVATGTRESLQDHPSKEKKSPKAKTDVYFQSNKMEFPATEAGQTSTVKIKLCNKSSMDHQFRIVTPSAPFSMKCTSLVSKPSHFLKIPVYFSPHESGKHYEATVKFESVKSGEPLAVKLFANSV